MDIKAKNTHPQAPKVEPPKREPCRHERTYIAVRHESGLVLRKCSDCGRSVC